MKLKVSQRADEFFDLFTESSTNIRAAAELLKDLIEDYRDIELKARAIQDREHEGDEVTHAIIRRLNTTFITPMPWPQHSTMCSTPSRPSRISSCSITSRSPSPS